MQVDHTILNEIHIFRLDGNLTLNAVKVAKSVIRPVMDDESNSKILIDLGHVKLIDSSGIGFLVSSYNILKKREGRFVLFGLNSMILDIFRSTRLDSILSIADSEEDAIKLL